MRIRLYLFAVLAAVLQSSNSSAYADEDFKKVVGIISNSLKSHAPKDIAQFVRVNGTRLVPDCCSGDEPLGRSNPAEVEGWFAQAFEEADLKCVAIIKNYGSLPDKAAIDISGVKVGKSQLFPGNEEDFSATSFFQGR